MEAVWEALVEAWGQASEAAEAPYLDRRSYQ
jgi:hypothetical protein